MDEKDFQDIYAKCVEILLMIHSFKRSLNAGRP